MRNIKRLAISIIALALFMIAAIGITTYFRFFPRQLTWGNPRVIEQSDNVPYGYIYLAILKHQEATYPDLDGNDVLVPRRLVFYLDDEYTSPETTIQLKVGDTAVLVPKSDLSFDLNIPDLPIYLERLNNEYATSSDLFSEAHTSLALLPTKNGQMNYVMGRLRPRQATRTVWSIDQNGKPSPLFFYFTHDRRGYRYRPEFTEHDILFADLELLEE